MLRDVDCEVEDVLIETDVDWEVDWLVELVEMLTEVDWEVLVDEVEVVAGSSP